MRDDWTLKGTPADRAAMLRLLTEAGTELRELASPSVVAMSPRKFDDTGAYPYWLGVQAGKAMWERSDYRWDGGGRVQERAYDPDDLDGARAVLNRLQKSEWRQVVNRAFSLDFGLTDETLALIIQYGATWLVFSPAEGGEDAAFLLAPDGPIYVGLPDRLDQRLGMPQPLLLGNIEPASWPAVQTLAPLFPCAAPPSRYTTKRPEAYARFVDAVRSAFRAMRTIPGSVQYLAAARQHPSGGWGWLRWRRLGTDAIDFELGRESKEQQAQMLARGGAPAEELYRILDALDAANWLQLYSDSVSPLPREEPLGLLVRGVDSWLIVAQTAVFGVTEAGDLQLVGACGAIDSATRARHGVVHPLSSRP